MKPTREKDNKKAYLKAISLILALLLWFYVANEGADYRVGQDVAEVKLEYKNVAEGLKIKGPDKVKVYLWGVFQGVGQISAYVDLAQKKPGAYSLPVNLKPVSGALFTRVEPRTVNVALEKIEENTVPITYKIMANPPWDYQLLDIVIEPEHCLIRGDQDIINKVSSAVCQVDLSNIKTMTTLELELAAVDKNNNVISSGATIIPDTVKVFAIVGQTKTTKEVAVKAVIDGQAAEGYRVKNIILSDEIVKIIGPESVVNSINELNTEPINLNESEQSFTATVTVNAPEGISAYPQKLQASIEIEEIKENERN